MIPELRFSLLSRRSVAISLWSILILSTGCAFVNLSFEVSFLQMAVVSVVSSCALLLTGKMPGLDARERHLSQRIFTAVAITIAFCWTMLLGRFYSPQATMVLFAIGVLPIIVVSLSMPLSTNSPPNYRDRSSSTNPLFPVATALESPKLTRAPDQALNKPQIPVPIEGRLFSPEDQTSVESEFDMPDSPSVTQWMTRTVTDEGDVIEGGVRVEFAQGQRDVTVHLSFCPPFGDVPELVTEDLDALDVEIRVAATYPFGARLTVRRSVAQPGLGNELNAESLRVGFVAIAPPVRRAA